MKPHITKNQIKMIKTLQRNNLDDDDYYEMLDGRFGVESCTELSRAQAGKVIDMFAEWGFFVPVPAKRKKRRRSGKPSPRKDGNMVRMASREEHEKIAAVARLIEWRLADGLERWMLARFKIKKVRTAQDAYRVIEGLKKMFENRMRKIRGDDWWMHEYDDPEVREYIKEHCPAAFR